MQPTSGRAPTVHGTRPRRGHVNPRADRRPATLASIYRELPPVVYFIRTDDGLIKIGHTQHLERRRAVFGRGWDRVLAVVPGDLDAEKAMHARFAERMRRHEHLPTIEAVEAIVEWYDFKAQHPNKHRVADAQIRLWRRRRIELMNRTAA